MLHDFAAGSWQLNHRGVYKRGSRRFPGERNLIDWGEVFDDLQNPFTCPLISLNLTICELKVWGPWFRATSHCGKGVLLEETVIFFKWTLSKETLIQRNLMGSLQKGFIILILQDNLISKMAWQFVPQNSSDSSGRKAQYKGELKRVNLFTNFVIKTKFLWQL